MKQFTVEKIYTDYVVMDNESEKPVALYNELSDDHAHTNASRHAYMLNNNMTWSEVFSINNVF